jgi:Protein of unknown function (DUF3237)
MTVSDDPLFPKLEFAFEVRLKLKKRLSINGLPGGGDRLSVVIEEGEFEGPALRGKVIPFGGEWPHVREDGVFCFDARYHLQEEDGTIIYLQNAGFRHAPDDVMERLWSLRPGDEVAASEYYLRTSAKFETAHGKHDWLSRHVFVGVGERTEHGNRIRYYRVC